MLPILGQLLSATCAVVTDTTPVAVIAAPSDSSQSIYIHSITYTNKTVAEDPTLFLKDTAGTPATVDSVTLGDAGPQSVYRAFDPPLKVAAGMGVTLEAAASTGDSYATVRYRVGPSDR